VLSVSTADRCPSCGARYGRRRVTWLWVVVGVILFFLVLIYLASQTLMAEDPSSPAQSSSKQ
jgi:uncharacterized integral membrane protein